MDIYKEIFLNSPIPRLIFKVDEKSHSFIYEEANQAACKLFNTDRESLLNTVVGEALPKAISSHILQALRTCFRTKKNITIQSIADLLDTAEVQAFGFTPMIDEKGVVKRVDMIGRMNLPHNIQLRKERDDAVSMLTSIFDTSTVGIVVLDRHHRIVRVNDVFVESFGWARTNLIGESFDRLTSQDDFILFTKEDEKNVERHQINEIKIKTFEGENIDAFVTTAFLELTSKRRFKIATILDISKQKELENTLRDAKEDAESANRAKSAFLANMSHELRTPLNAIIGFTELIKNGTFGFIDNPKYEEYLTDILFSAQHLLDIINDVLDMSKIDAGKVEIHDRDVDIEDLFNSVKRIMHDRVDAAELELIIDIEENLPDLFADRRWLRQMLMNLVSNSIKFSPQNSQVIMKAHILNICDETKMRLTVTDFGEGIEQEKIETVLEPFGQVKEAETNMGQGTGLGLPLAKAMAEMHEATFTLLSTFNEGTTIHVDFPASRILDTQNPLQKDFKTLKDSPNHMDCSKAFKTSD